MYQGKWLRKAKNGLNVVFIHGINSSDNCWKNKNGSYWPELLKHESELVDIGIYVFSYRTGLNTGFYSLSDIVDSLREYFVLDDLVNSEGVIFVCHSMGGIVARRFLVNQYSKLIERGLSKIGLFLVASPSLGSEYANMLGLLFSVMGHTQADALKFSQANVWLNDLDKDFINLRANDNLRIKGKELIEDLPLYGKGFIRRQVVEPFSGAKYFGNSFKVPGSDHSTIATPADRNAVQHRLLVQFIKEFLKEEFGSLGLDNVSDYVESAVSPAPNALPCRLRPVTLRVYHFENYGQHAEDVSFGERIAGVLLNQLLALDLQAETAEEVDPVQLWGYRSRPPDGSLTFFRELVPFIMITGYVEDIRATDRFNTYIRVGFVDRDINPKTLMSEVVECCDDPTEMQTAFGDLPVRILEEARRVSGRIELLLTRLREADTSKSQQARDELIKLGPVRQVCAEISVAAEPGNLLPLLDVLEKIADQTAVIALRPLLKHRDERVMKRAAQLLGRLRDTAAAPVLLAELEQNLDGQDKVALIALLAPLKYEPAIPVFGCCLGDLQPEVRVAAIQALSAVGGSVSQQWLVTAVNDNEHLVRLEAMVALRTYRRDTSLVPILRERLNDPEVSIQRIAARALAEIGDVSGTQILLDEIAESERIDALGAEEPIALLRALRDRTLIPRLVELTQSLSPIARGCSAELLGVIAGRDAIEPLSSLINDREYFPRYKAILALGEIHHSDTQLALAHAMQDEHHNCREAAVIGYLESGRPRPEDREVLRTLVRTQDREERFYGLLGLARSGDSSALWDLADQVSARYFSVQNMWRSLSREEVLSILSSLTPSYRTATSLSDWAAWIKEHERQLKWNPETQQFSVNNGGLSENS